MLRYRFDDLEQLSRHLHVVEGGALIFLRDHRKDVQYERVLLELSVRQSGEKAVVRGEVVARAAGHIRGAWLRLADARIARRLSERAAFSARRLPRVSTDQLIRLRRGTGQEVVAQLLDVGSGGLRVRGASGLCPGEWCDARLIGATAITSDLGRAEVVRIEGMQAALRFATAGNAAVLRLVQTLQQGWRQALELDHLPECCADGHPLEPAMPHMSRRLLAVS